MEHILPELKYRALVSLRKFHINRCMIELTIEKLTSQKPRKSSYRDTETIEQAYGIYRLTRPLHTKIKSNQNWKHYL